MKGTLTPDKIQNILSVIDAINKFEVGYNLIDEYPRFYELCQTYKAALNALKTLPETYRGYLEIGEMYVREHVLHDKTVLHLVWYIPHLNELVSKQMLKSKKFKVGPLCEWIDFTGLDMHRMEFALNNNKTVMVIDYAPSQLEVLIDGNHRVASMYLKNKNKDALVSGYLVPSKIHSRALISDFQRSIYKILSNIGRIVNYIDKLKANGKASKPELFRVDHLLDAG